MEHIYQNITGWFTFFRFYKDMVARFPDSSTIVEVGTYSGMSMAYLLVEAINQNKKFEVTAVDSFTFSDESTGENILDALIRNLEPLDYEIDIIKEQSWDAAEMFKDESVDLCFIDADHRYESVKKDILAWRPKIKKGGILAGHDWQPDHPGVERAITEIFGAEAVHKEYLDEWVWYVIIE